MAYSELIKNFDRIRDYMREFYLYGFRSRSEFTRKSARSYDDERRRVESWLGDYMSFRYTPEGKNMFLSIDSRVSRHNPLYAAWKTKSFTDGDITLHFILFDLLNDPGTAMTAGEISEAADRYLSGFPEPKVFDESTVRKKLKEYAAEGIVTQERRGRTVVYRRTETPPVPGTDALDFFAETAPCGVIGSFLLDKTGAHRNCFAFKHHYITAAMDSEICCTLLTAMGENRAVTLRVIRRRKNRTDTEKVVPLRIRTGAQGGRQHLLAWVPRLEQMDSFRLDNILSAEPEEPCARKEEYLRELERMLPRLWGVSVPASADRPTEHISFTVEYTDRELHIHSRLDREKRCGAVERLTANSSRFSAEVYDTLEMLPWIRTFICRITRFECSNRETESRFREDLLAMYRAYGLEGGEEE